MAGGLKQSDETLVNAARKGDRQAFGALVERYQDAVCAIAYSRVGNRDAAEDIAQDAFLASLEGLGLLRSPSKYGGWLARIARKLCERWHRSEHYRRALVEGMRQLGRAERAKTPEEAAEARENEEIVGRAIEQLPLKLREALVLYYFKGRSAGDAAQILGVSREAVLKRLERARHQIRGYISTEVERRLERERPGKDFSRRTVAAIPIGSVCARLGMEVARVGVGEAMREAARAAVQNSYKILEGGGLVVTAKKAIVAAAVLLIAGGAGYVIFRGRGGPEEGIAGAPAREAVGEENALGPEQEGAGRLPGSLSGIATVEEMNELLVKGCPEFGQMDEETRLEAMRQMVRDALERNVRLDLIQEELNFGRKLHAEGRIKEALAVFLAIYDVASNSDNYPRSLQGGMCFMDPDNPWWTLANFIDSAATRASFIYLYEFERKDMSDKLWLKARDDVEHLISVGVASGRDRAILLYMKTGLDQRTGLGGPSRAEMDQLHEYVAGYLEKYLQGDQVAPEDRWATSYYLANLYRNLEMPEKALAMYERLEEDAASLGFVSTELSRAVDRLKGELALASLEKAEQREVGRSKSNLSRLGQALYNYTKANDGRFPTSLEELAAGGYVTDMLLVDPVTGERYQYVVEFNEAGQLEKVAILSGTLNGLSVCYVPGRGTIVMAEQASAEPRPWHELDPNDPWSGGYEEPEIGDSNRIDERGEIIKHARHEDALAHPEVIAEAANKLLEGIVKMSERGGEPAMGSVLYTVQTNWPAWATWMSETLRSNPVKSVELGEAYKHTGPIAYRMISPEGSAQERSYPNPHYNDLPAVQYRITLEDGTVLEGDLPFEYSPFSQEWQGKLGLDFHRLGN